MAMTDRETTFSNHQAVTTGTQVSTDKYDTGLAGHPNINTNRELQVLAVVTTEFAGGTSLRVDLVESANADLSSPTVLATSGVVNEADLTVGKRLLATSLPRTSKRYLGLQFVTVGTHSAGKVWGGLVRDIDDTAFPAQHTGFVA
jgi:predicted deacylase